MPIALRRAAPAQPATILAIFSLRPESNHAPRDSNTDHKRYRSHNHLSSLELAAKHCALPTHNVGSRATARDMSIFVQPDNSCYSRATTSKAHHQHIHRLRPQATHDACAHGLVLVAVVPQFSTRCLHAPRATHSGSLIRQKRSGPRSVIARTRGHERRAEEIVQHPQPISDSEKCLRARVRLARARRSLRIRGPEAIFSQS
ncbi:hypothetical protein C8Q80DRAFT_750172 [Daedaleopsis nitida]|nr:hypothetical protein C8Q80DRAFT_750172 [Daedaleopsis nitida]